MIAEIPSGIPNPDGSLPIHQAGADVRRLNRESTNATNRLLDYVMRGTFPEGYENVHEAEAKAAGSGL